MLAALVCLAVLGLAPAPPGQAPLAAGDPAGRPQEPVQPQEQGPVDRRGPAAPAGSNTAAAGREPPDRGVFPYVGTLVSGSGLSAGIGYREEAILGSPLGGEALAAWSIRGYQRYRARVGLIGQARETLALREAESGVASLFNDASVKHPGHSLYAEARWRSYPRQPFFGIGAGSSRADRSAYELSGPAFDIVGQWQPAAPLGLSARAGVIQPRIGPHLGDPEHPPVEARFDPRAIPAYLDAPRRFTVVGAGAALDRRDNPFAPSRGFFLGGAAWRYEAAGGRFDFTRLSLDARGFAPAGPGAFAVRLLVSTDLAADDAEVPFFLLQTLGGGETLRGYDTQRWRAPALGHFTAEYRWRAHRFVEVAPFADIAAVGPGLARLSGTRLRTAGVALRALWADRVIGRLEVAASPEGSRLLLSTGPIF